MTNLQTLTALLCGAALFGASARAQHIHIAAGAESGEQDARLFFSNGFLFDVNSYGGVTPACIYMEDNDPLYPGLYQTSASFIALPSSPWTGGPTPFAAQPGTHIEMIIRSVEGPAGGEIGFWVENEEATETRKQFVVRSGQSGSTNRFNLSEGVTFPEYDPFGHIHGRRFTATKSGLYTVGVQLIDTSTLGPGGGPFHSPSLTNYFYFQAGLQISQLSMTNGVFGVRFGSRGFQNYFLDATDSLPATEWTTLGHIIGAAHSDLHWLEDPGATNAMRFYRIREVPQ
jgi:hypothetical protein